MNDTLSSNAEKIACRWTNGANTIGGSVVTVNEKGVKIRLYDNSGTLLDHAEITANRPAIHPKPTAVK